MRVNISYEANSAKAAEALLFLLLSDCDTMSSQLKEEYEDDGSATLRTLHESVDRRLSGTAND